MDVAFAAISLRAPGQDHSLLSLVLTEPDPEPGRGSAWRKYWDEDYE